MHSANDHFMMNMLNLIVFIASAVLLGFRTVISIPIAVVPEKTPVLPPVEWFGDPRGGNPNDEFYDVSYDDVVCPAGLRSSAVRNYAYVGTVIKTMKNGNNTDDCLRECYQLGNCKSVNVYFKRKNACELNADDQFGDPTKLVSVSNAIYYDRIQCPFPPRS